MKAFANGIDPYAVLASGYYKKTYEECYKLPNGDDTPERKRMKFGMLASIYGTGPGTLAQQIGGTVEEAKEFLTGFMREYGRISRWIKSSQGDAKRNGFVWIGDRKRKRRLPDAKRKVRGYNSEVMRALRQGPNAEVQGESAIQTKMTLIELDKICQERGWLLWATIHDEILVLIPETFTREDIDVFESVMVNTYKFGDVPNGTDIEVGTRWGELVSPEEWFLNRGDAA